MECAEYSLDELLCQSLLLFRQYRLYDDPDCFVNASRMLEEVRRLIDNTQSGVDMAKWGCVVECLAQKFYISSDTDTMLGEFDVALAAYWKRIEKSPLEPFTVYLWLGYYCLLRFRNGHSHSHSRSKQMMSNILSFLIDTFRKFKEDTIPAEILPFFSADIWGETVCWMEQVHDTRICEKQSAVLLGQLYNMKKMEVQQEQGTQDTLLQHILEFYCF